MSSAAVLGLDVGGSSVKLLLTAVDSSLSMPPHPLLKKRSPTPLETPVEGLLRLVESVRQEKELARLVLSIPGIVDEERGLVVQSANIPALDGRDLSANMEDVLGIPVDLINDGHAAAVAEAQWGAGQHAEDVFVLALGTGVAGAHVRDGSLVSGAHGSAGELGHIVVEPGGYLCSCGRAGCLETVIGVPALRDEWRRSGGSGGVEQLFIALAADDEAARLVVGRASAALGEALLTLCALVDPGLIVVGGGLASEPDRLVVPARQYVHEHASFHRVPEIKPAVLGQWAGAYGAVLTALRRGVRITH